MTLTLGCHKSSCTHLFDYMYNNSPQRLQQFLGHLQLKHFSIQKTKVTKSDLASNKVKVNPGASFEYIW